jgi:hypothetical protein
MTPTLFSIVFIFFFFREQLTFCLQTQKKKKKIFLLWHFSKAFVPCSSNAGDLYYTLMNYYKNFPQRPT